MTDTSAASVRTTLDTPWTGLLCIYVVVYATAWVLLAMAVDPQVPGDNIEQLTWVQHLAWGYSKHPPFPTMMLWVAERVFPHGVPLTRALGACEGIFMLWIAYYVACAIYDRRAAIVVVLLISCISYYTHRLTFYNHNTALLMAYAASVYVTMRAAQTPRALWFVLLGAIWGIGMLSKYQMVIGIACNVAYFWTVREGRVLLLFRQLCLAAVVCGLVLVPHVLWLMDNHFPTFDYAGRFVAANFPWSERPADIVGFLGSQTGRVGPPMLLLILMRLLPQVRSAAADMSVQSTVLPTSTKQFLAIHAWGPFVLMTALSLFFGIDLQMHWGTAFIWMVPVWFLSTARGREVAAIPLPLLFAGVATLQIVSLLVY